MRAIFSPAWKVSAGVAAASVVLLSASPGMAAEPVAQARATALTLTVLSTPTDSGSYAVTNDGRRETSTGSSAPLITALGQQPFLSAGTLAQDASTRVVNGQGRSNACAGLAGDNATLVSAGDNNTCLTPGDNLTLTAANLDLSNLQIVQADLLAGLDAQLQAALQPLLTPVLAAVQSTLQTALAAVGDAGVFLDVGAIQSRCSASPSAVEGESDITDVTLFAEIAGTRIDLVELPVNAPPNTKVLTDLDVVVEAITDGLAVQLNTAIGGALGTLTPVLTQLRDALNDNLISVIADQLGPLEENILDITLNRQVRSPGAIEVTALDLAVLPAAESFGVDVLAAEIGQSSCGPNGRVGDNPPPDPTDPIDPSVDPNVPGVPTNVPAGLSDEAAGRTDDGALNAQLAAGGIAALLALSGLAGVAAYRRAAQR